MNFQAPQVITRDLVSWPLRFPTSLAEIVPPHWIPPSHFSAFLVFLQGHFGSLHSDCPSQPEREKKGHLSFMENENFYRQWGHTGFLLYWRGSKKTESGCDRVVLKSPPGLSWGFVCLYSDDCIWRGHPQKSKVNHHLQNNHLIHWLDWLCWVLLNSWIIILLVSQRERMRNARLNVCLVGLLLK